ncbi:restriction endonuclease subunit S [Vibrio ostreicida]|uniref:restriction endonuclease subunit S n=1 Tax=Vibrio ostreicida TaxID=526588 RepID=UPI003B59FAFA
MSWPTVRIKDVAEVINGRAYKKHEMLAEGKYPLMRVGNFFSNRSWYFSDLELPDKQYCDTGDLLYAWSASFGPRIWDGGKVIYHYHIWKLVLDESLVDKNYLFYVLQNDVDKIKQQQGTGSTMIHVTKVSMENREIPLPPLETQKQIAEVLEKADQLRKDCQQMEQELNSLAQSVFIELFGDPVTNPKGWDVKPLSCLLSQPLQNGAYYPKEDYSDDGVEMVHMGDVFYDFIPRGGMKRVNASKKDIEKYKLTSNDLLISRRSLMLEGAAKPSLIEESSEDLIFESSMIRLTPNNKILNVMYLFYYLSNPIVKQHFIYQYITGATIKGINQSNLEKVEVLVPDYKMQEDFLIIEQKIRNQKNDLLNLVKEYEDNYNALMQKAFKGELNL